MTQPKNDLSNYLTLGHSGLRVSPFCLGTMTFGEDWGWGSSPADSHSILSRYLELGGNFIDTANLYTNGHSEQIIGDYLSAHPDQRDKLVLATKFFGSLQPGNPNAGGCGRKAIVSACEASLKRLQTDYIDLYWMHGWDWHTPIEETMRALDDLVKSGKVRYIGFSDTPAWKVAQAQLQAQFRGWSPLIALQIEYSLLERSVEAELIPMASELGLGVMPWSPLKAGLLSGKYRRGQSTQTSRGAASQALLTEQTENLIEALFEIAEQHHSSPARVALSWVQQQAGVASTIIGARTLNQLEDNLAALALQLSPAEEARLAQLSQPKFPFPVELLRKSAGVRNPGASINGERTPWRPLTDN